MSKKIKKLLIFLSVVFLIAFVLNYFKSFLKSELNCYPFPQELDGYACIEKDILKESRTYPLNCGNKYFNPELIYIVKYANNGTALNFYAAKADYFDIEKCPKANFDYVESTDMISKDTNFNENEKKAYFDLEIDDQNFQRIITWTKNDYYFMINNSGNSRDSFLSREKLDLLTREFDNLIKN